jgi:2-keto-4-pentenoate hydratase/2-oxohepta-3-ene-1,7-dioic acid hydratase in catechol pathway
VVLPVGKTVKLITFEHAGTQKIGAMASDTEALDIAAAWTGGHGSEDPRFNSMQNLIEGGDSALDGVRELLEHAPENCQVSLADIKLLAPLPVPMQIRDFAAFELHCIQALESSMQMRAKLERPDDPEAACEEYRNSGTYTIPDVWYQQPLYFKANRFNCIGHEQNVVWPNYANVLDYELEYAAIIGRKAKDVAESDAGDYIFGYTIFNDFTARDAQAVEMQFRMGPAKGKDFDTGTSIGPWIVTRDEMTDPYSSTMKVRVNGEERGRGSSGSSQHRFERCIEHVSQSETIYPGEILASGTVGNGSGFEIQRYLEPGDIVELEVDGIGILRNQVIKPE